MTKETEINLENFKKDFLSGMLLKDLKYKYKCGSKLITGIKKRHNLSRKRVAHNKRHDIPEKKAIILYKKGISTIKIGEKYNCCSATILCILKKYHIKIRVSPVLQKDMKIRSKKREIIDWYVKKKKSAYVIAEKFNANEGTIRAILRENNIKIRTVQEARIFSNYTMSKKVRNFLSERMKNGGAIKALKGCIHIDTKPMKIFENYLIINKINYKKEFGVEGKAYDFFIPSQNLLVEIDGNYWHNYPYGTKRDREKDKIARKNNFQLIRFWESNINNKFVLCIEQLKNKLKEETKDEKVKNGRK